MNGVSYLTRSQTRLLYVRRTSPSGTQSETPNEVEVLLEESTEKKTKREYLKIK